MTQGSLKAMVGAPMGLRCGMLSQSPHFQAWHVLPNTPK